MLGAVAAEKVLAAAPRGARTKRTALVISLRGDLGAGKTTFVQGFLRALGVKGGVTSPTFVLVKRFRLGAGAKKKGLERAYHVDAYRLRSPGDAATLGLADAFADPRAVVLIEWPERLEKILPKRRVKLYFSHGRRGENGRVMKASGGVVS